MNSSTDLLVAGLDCPWLPPVSFAAKPFRELCQSFDRELKALEAKYPSHHRGILTIEGRAKRLKKKRRRPK